MLGGRAEVVGRVGAVAGTGQEGAAGGGDNATGMDVEHLLSSVATDDADGPARATDPVAMPSHVRLAELGVDVCVDATPSTHMPLMRGPRGLYTEASVGHVPALLDDRQCNVVAEWLGMAEAC